MSDPTHVPVPTPTEGSQPAQPALPTTDFSIVCWPRAIFIWPLVAMMLVAGLLSANSIIPDYVSGLTLHIAIIVTILVREFDFKTIVHLALAVLLSGTALLICWLAGLIPPLAWFSAAGAGCCVTGLALALILLVNILIYAKAVHFRKRADGVYVSGGGLSGLLTAKAKITGSEADVAESVLICGRIREFGDLAFDQAKEGHVIQPFSATLEGVFDPKGVAARIKVMLS